MTTHTLLILMQDRPGALQRTITLFRRRSFNLQSVAVGPSEKPGVSRMTVVVEAEDVEQVVKQLYGIIEVLKVTELTDAPAVHREVALIKIHVPQGGRAEAVALANVFGAKVLDVGARSMVLEVAAYPTKVENFIDVLRPFGIKELVRSGRIAMTRGTQVRPLPGAREEEEHEAVAAAG
ncbi:MAG TPA: acetolactate synthase small subunit [Longimicrobiales bacterium]|nr:acetolactate synthase small subunit [Longimicrobiales bacterium]